MTGTIEHCATPGGDTDDDQEPTPENIARALQELKDMGLLVDSGRRRNGQIVWITREQAELERLKRN